MKNNLFAYNSANPTVGRGGGLFLQSNWTAIEEFTNNTFHGNSASDGGALVCFNLLPVTMTNCIFWENIALTNPDISVGIESPTLFFCDYAGGWAGAGAGNIDADPQFASSSEGEHYLEQNPPGLSGTSPCVDAGDPASTVLTGTTRTDGAQDAFPVDMGDHYPIP